MSERSESKRIGAKQHKNSGRNNKKGDATWRNFIVDFKEVSKSFTLNKDVWAKAVTDSIKSGTDKSPAIIVILGEGITSRSDKRDVKAWESELKIHSSNISK